MTTPGSAPSDWDPFGSHQTSCKKKKNALQIRPLERYEINPCDRFLYPEYSCKHRRPPPSLSPSLSLSLSLSRRGGAEGAGG